MNIKNITNLTLPEFAFVEGSYHERPKKMNSRERIGVMIRELRQNKGLTQQELADLSGMNRTTIGKIESGKFNASIDLISKLIKPLGAELDIKEVD